MTPRGFDLSRVPVNVRAILERLRGAGHGAWLVGGAVRDTLLGLPPKDWDVATDARAEDVMALFPRVAPVGLRFGTVQVLTDAGPVEVTSTRAFGGIREDLARRDFTVNAFAVTWPEGAFLDLAGGLRDLSAMRLRGVGDPAVRFHEDPLRILRAARLVAQFGFHVTPKTFAAMKAGAPGLGQVAVERVRDELQKLLLGAHVAEGLEVARKCGALHLMIPEMFGGKGRGTLGWRGLVSRVGRAPARLRARMTAFLAGPGPAVALRVMERLLAPPREAQKVVALVRCLGERRTLPVSPAEVRRLIARIGGDLVADFMDVWEASCAEDDMRGLGAVAEFRIRVAEELARGFPLSVKDLAVNGRDVAEAAGVPPGPEVGRILRRLFENTLDRPEWNSRMTLLGILKGEPPPEGGWGGAGNA